MQFTKCRKVNLEHLFTHIYKNSALILFKIVEISNRKSFTMSVFWSHHIAKASDEEVERACPETVASKQLLWQFNDTDLVTIEFKIS